jgi:branched-chain amino acid transport system permease protein
MRNLVDIVRTNVGNGSPGDRLLRDRSAWLLWGALAIIAAIAPLVATQRQVFVMMNVLVLAVFATSFNVILGYTGMVSFAHAAYYGVGAYTVTLMWVHLGWPPMVGFVLAPFVAGLVAYITGLIALRAAQLYFALLTLAIGQLLFVVTFQWRALTRGDDGIHGVPLPDLIVPITNRYYFLLLAAGIALAILGAVMRSPFGATLQAIRENGERAGFLGIKVKRYQLASFTLGGAFAGYAGAMFVFMDRGAFPLLLHWTTSAEPIFVALIGGLNSFVGPTIGAIIFVLLRDWVTRRFVFWGLILGGVLLLIILRMPGGTVEAVQRLVARLRGRDGERIAGARSPSAAAAGVDAPKASHPDPTGDRPSEERLEESAGKPTSGGER